MASWPSSTPRLKPKSESPRFSRSSPISSSAPAKPNPWNSPNPNTTSQIRPRNTGNTRSAAAIAIEAAITTSTSRPGRWTSPSEASDERHAVSDRERRDDLHDVDQGRHEVRALAPAAVAPDEHRREQQGDEEHHVIEAHPDVIGAEPDDRQEAAQASAARDVELLPGRPGAEDQRDPPLVGERTGCPVVLDEQETAVPRHLVEEHAVVDGQPLGDAIEPLELERQQDEAAPDVEHAVLREADRQRRPPRQDVDMLTVVGLQEVDLLRRGSPS